MRFSKAGRIGFAALLCFASVAAAQEDSATELALQARSAVARGDSVNAVQLATRALAHDLQDDEVQYLFYVRGREHFRLGKIAESAADFDAYAERFPAEKPKLWERGITLYYAERFRDGADQFALYQKYLSNDVENAAWRFLCMSREVGVEKARAELLPIEGDRRIPMMTLYRFYRGETTEAEVLREVEAGKVGEAERAGRRFYAALYLGLFYEASGDDEKAKPFLAQAASPNLQKSAAGAINPYMGDVARIHQLERQSASQQAAQ